MEQQAMLNQAYVAWTVVRRISFWMWWAIVVLFVIPSVMACAVLAIGSSFSFASIPRIILQDEAETARYPAAPAGMLKVRVCKDPVATRAYDKSLPPLPSVVCETYGYEHRSIEAIAQQASHLLWLGYVFAVITGCVFVWVTGALELSHRAFCRRLNLATKLRTTPPGKSS